jgi:hypothetical protein
MAVEDGVAGRLVAIAAAVVGDLVGVGRARADRLAVQVGRAVAVGREHPLVRVKVEDVVLGGARMDVAEPDVVADVAVVDVRGVVRIVGDGRPIVGIAWVLRTGRHVDDHGRIADHPAGQEELLVLALVAAGDRADALAVGQNLGADAARAVIDRETVAHAVQRMREPAHLVLELRECLDGEDLVVEDDGELAKRLLACPEIEAGGLRDMLVRLEDRVVVEGVQWEVAPAR